jgi:Zn-dependent protease with chaperone function
MKQLLTLIAFVTAIPVVGLSVGGYIRADFNREWLNIVTKELGAAGAKAVNDGKFSLDNVCRKPNADVRSACETFQHVTLLFNASGWCLVVGLCLLMGIYLAARLAGANRALLVAVFSPGLKFVLLIVFGLVIVQGSIAVYALYIGESYAIQRIHGGLILAIGIGAFIGAFTMIRAGLSISKRARSIAIGKTVVESEQPELWGLVKKVAQEVNATVPKNIVLGVAPNFYVTSSDVTVYPEARTYSDETLYLSLPLMRLLSRSELLSVVGHELGHFKGEDTAFSLRFYPIYAGTGQALNALAMQREGAQVLALLPAIAILSYFMQRFSIAENTIGRQREFEADKIGASVGSPRALGTALLKIGAIAPLWHQMRQAMIDKLAERQMFTNASQFFADAAKGIVTDEHIRQVGTSGIHHPTDTHPSTAARIEAFGLSVSDLVPDALKFDDSVSAVTLIAAVEGLETAVSDFEHRLLIETGQVVVPPESHQEPKATSSGSVVSNKVLGE